MRDLAVALGLDLHMAEAGAAARAPGHVVVTAVQPAALVAGLDDAPDRVVVLLGHRVVRVSPVHPLAKADALLGDDARKLEHAVLAKLDEFGDAVPLDVPFRAETQLFFSLDFYP